MLLSEQPILRASAVKRRELLKLFEGVVEVSEEEEEEIQDSEYDGNFQNDLKQSNLQTICVEP